MMLPLVRWRTAHVVEDESSTHVAIGQPTEKKEQATSLGEVRSLQRVFSLAFDYDGVFH